MSCVSPVHLIIARAKPDKVQALTASEDPIMIPSLHGPRAHLQLTLQQQYQIVRSDEPDLGPWKIQTRAYNYRLDDDQGRELAAWHWQPDGLGPEKRPHVHVAVAGGRLHGCHLPTSRVSVEGILRLLLAELNARPRRPDWPAILDAAEEAFQEYRTWG